jgi:hypothetical protein
MALLARRRNSCESCRRLMPYADKRRNKRMEVKSVASRMSRMSRNRAALASGILRPLDE